MLKMFSQTYTARMVPEDRAVHDLEKYATLCRFFVPGDLDL